MLEDPADVEEPWLAAEELAARINWDRVIKEHPPSQEWFDRDEPKPF